MADSPLERNIQTLAGEYESQVGVAIPFVYGELQRHLMERKPPVFMWLHTGGTFEQPGRQRQTVNEQPPTNPRAEDLENALAELFAWEQLEVHCWGEDTGQADTMWRNICRLLVRELSEAVAFTRLYWFTEQPANASPFNDGAIKVVGIRWRMSIPGDLAPMTELEDFDHTASIGVAGDDGCECTPTP